MPQHLTGGGGSHEGQLRLKRRSLPGLLDATFGVLSFHFSVHTRQSLVQAHALTQLLFMLLALLLFSIIADTLPAHTQTPHRRIVLISGGQRLGR